MDSINTKAALRKQVLKIRDQLTPEERNRSAVLLTERICGHQWFYRSDILLAFVSYGSEIDTTEIIEEAIRRGKKVYVPRIEGNEMNFYRVNDLTTLEIGYKGIREPARDAEPFHYYAEQADRVLMLMPGAVFDHSRNRCGYGKGFYDRYLADKEALQQRTIGIGFRCQLIEELPAQEWDIRPCQVICI